MHGKAVQFIGFMLLSEVELFEHSKLVFECELPCCSMHRAHDYAI